MSKAIIRFIKQKEYKFIKELGQGGLGKTVLILDSEIGEQFVCKKYSPYDESLRDEYYDYFKNEIKVMFQVNHSNIIRIFNYYLYPEQRTGYILMEYVDGKNIYEFLLENPASINNVFEQIIDAFVYLENHKILHRDIRLENILIDNNGVVKIIDFGFGKKVIQETDKKKSISLNWWCDVPSEFSDGLYDHQTDLYFIGKLFEAILSNGADDWVQFDFAYRIILEKMMRTEKGNRYQSFSQIKEEIVESSFSYEDLFSYQEKESYKKFVNDFAKAISKVDENTKYHTDINRIVVELENIYRANVLEDEIQNTRDVTRAFLNGSYKFYNRPIFSCYNMREIIRMLKAPENDKANIIMLNIHNRLNQIPRTHKDDLADDIPF